LAKHQARQEERLTVVEGLRECERALGAGMVPVEAYGCPELMIDQAGTRLWQRLTQLEQQGRSQCFEITPELYAKLAYREESTGLLLVIPYLDTRLATLPQRAPAFFVVIEGVEKPGNLGAILRTADAAGVDGVIVCAGATDLHNPNVIRASLGTLFTVPIAEVSTGDTIAWLRANHIQIIAAAPDATERYTKVNLALPVAIVMGSEAHGLGAAWRSAADQLVSIPMHGVADSLNLATATALLLYEVRRQRAESVTYQVA
jgi:TrmH family RNA methyltransferase